MAGVPSGVTVTDAELRSHFDAEHIMGMPAVARNHWTAADVRALMDESRHWPRYELLGGELLVTHAPTLAHQWAVAELAAQLGAYCETQGIGVVLVSPADVELEPESIMQPDVFVVPRSLIPSDQPMEWPHVTALLLAVEVLSPSTMHIDRVRKRDFYLTHRVDEYWIVDLDARVIERWTPASNRPGILRDALEWRPTGSSAPFVLDVAGFFAANRGLKRLL